MASSSAPAPQISLRGVVVSSTGFGPRAKVEGTRLDVWLLIDALGEPGATLSNTAEHFGVPVDIHRHAGVLLVSPERFPLQRRAPGALVAALERFIETTTAELTDVVVWLTE